MRPDTRAPTAYVPAEGSVDILALWNLVWAYRLVIIASALLGAGIAAVLGLTATPMFRAEVTLTEVSNPGLGAVSSLSRQFGGIAALTGINLSGVSGEGADARAVLNSRKLTEEFLGRPDMVREVFGESKSAPSLWMAVERFRSDRLSISEDQTKGTIRLSIISEDPVRAARWANDYVALANESLRARALGDSSRNVAYLNEQLAKTSSVEIQRLMYNLIENEMKSAMLANARADYAFAVVDPAVAPEQRFSPRRTLLAIFGCVLGGIAGIAVALLLHLVRRPAVPRS